MEFKDKVVLITGAAGGIGAATAREFAKEGAKLALVDLSMDALEDLAKTLNTDDYLLVTADVRDEEQVKNYVDKTVERFGRIDVFINNAGINGGFHPITEQPTENLKNVIEVNLYGAYWGLKYVLQVMKKQKSGSVVNMASVGGLIGSPGMSAYIASKHALIGINKCAAIEVVDYGIRVNAVCPSGVDTDMMKRIETNAFGKSDEETREAFAAGVPMKRYATPEEVAHVMLFLASDKASFLTGQYVRIDGGGGITSV